MRSPSSTFGLLFGKHLPRAFGSWLIAARPGPRARLRPRLASERRGGRSVSASVARGARDGFCCCAGRGVGPRRARCGVVPAFHTEGTHAAAPVLGRGPLPRVGLTTNQLEDRRWPTRALSLYTLALRVFVQFQQFLAFSLSFVGASVLRACAAVHLGSCLHLAHTVCWM